MCQTFFTFQSIHFFFSSSVAVSLPPVGNCGFILVFCLFHWFALITFCPNISIHLTQQLSGKTLDMLNLIWFIKSFSQLVIYASIFSHQYLLFVLLSQHHFVIYFSPTAQILPLYFRLLFLEFKFELCFYYVSVLLFFSSASKCSTCFLYLYVSHLTPLTPSSTWYVRLLA